jgi:hypothetical protein
MRIIVKTPHTGPKVQQPSSSVANGDSGAASREQACAKPEPIVMTETKQSPLNLASHQPSTQSKEVAVIALIALLRLIAQPLAAGVNTSLSGDSGLVAHLVYSWAVILKPYLIGIAGSAIAYLAIMQLTQRKIPRRVLDVFGILFILSMSVQFGKINLLLLTATGPANILLAEAVIFLSYFTVVWGWILWRIDAATKPETNTVIALEAEIPPTTMFDYYHASAQAVLHPIRLLSIRGLTKQGRLVVGVHNMMMLDLYAVVVGRFFQLVQHAV